MSNIKPADLVHDPGRRARVDALLHLLETLDCSGKLTQVLDDTGGVSAAQNSTSDPDLPAPYLRGREVAHRYGISLSRVYAWVKREGFPAPVQLAAGTSRWRLTDLLRWEAAR